MTSAIAAIATVILLLLAGSPALRALTDRSPAPGTHRSANIDRTLRIERANAMWSNGDLTAARPYFHQP